MAKQQYHRGGGAGRSGQRKASKRKGSLGGYLLLALVTLANLALSVLISLMNRQEVLHAVEEDETIKLLLTEKAGPVTKKLE